MGRADTKHKSIEKKASHKKKRIMIREWLVFTKNRCSASTNTTMERAQLAMAYGGLVVTPVPESSFCRNL